MTDDISVLIHSSIKIQKDKTIYFDPYNINESKDADIIFITHDHYDHYSEKDINKIKKENTIIIAPEDLYDKIIDNGFKKENIITVIPNQSYKVEDIEFTTIPSYNPNKKFHPKENNWVGYLINLNGIKYYIAGDTDITEENKKVNCDVAFLPIGGTYTMDYEEAAELTNIIKPKVVIPIHYGTVVGTKEDAEKFSKLINQDIECKILL